MREMFCQEEQFRRYLTREYFLSVQSASNISGFVRSALNFLMLEKLSSDRGKCCEESDAVPSIIACQLQIQNKFRFFLHSGSNYN